MKKHCLTKELYLLLVLIFITSCNQQDNSSRNTLELKDSIAVQHDAPKKIPSDNLQANNIAGDPTFEKGLDIISTYGPHSITRSVLEDKNGNIWLGSWEGITSYNGKLFTNHTLKEGLRQYHVISILEDRTGNLWFGTIGDGVYRYDGRGFTYFSTKEGLADNNVMCMLQDKAGNIWLGTGNGLSRYNGYAFTNFTPQDGLSGNAVYSIAEDKTGKLWFGTRYGVSCYNPSGSLVPGGKLFSDFKNKDGSYFSNVRSIIEDKMENIWIGSQEGVNRYNPFSNNNENAFTNITKNYTGCILEDKKGNLWLSAGGTDSERMILYRYDPSASLRTSEKGLTEILVSNKKQAPFFNQIFGIAEDRTGNIWFGTAKGVCRYNPSLKSGANPFTYFLKNELKQ